MNCSVFCDAALPSVPQVTQLAGGMQNLPAAGVCHSWHTLKHNLQHLSQVCIFSQEHWLYVQAECCVQQGYASSTVQLQWHDCAYFCGGLTQ